jgi:uncharacterized protein YkwD
VRSALPVIALLFALAPAALAAGGSRPAVQPVDSLEASVLGEVNAARVANGLRPLRFNSRLTAAARQHSLEMVELGYFAHESSDGSVFWRRIERFYRPGFDPRKWSVGENLIWHTQQVSARAAVRAWLRSPEHRDNLLGRAFREVGIAAVRAAEAPGVYGNRRVMVLTVDFGRR